MIWVLTAISLFASWRATLATLEAVELRRALDKALGDTEARGSLERELADLRAKFRKAVDKVASQELELIQRRERDRVLYGRGLN